MRFITLAGLNDIANYFKSRIDHARYVVGDVSIDIPVTNVTVDGRDVAVWIDIPLAVTNIDKLQIINVDGEVIIERDAPLTKPPNRGLTVRFPFVVREVNL